MTQPLVQRSKEHKYKIAIYDKTNRDEGLDHTRPRDRWCEEQFGMEGNRWCICTNGWSFLTEDDAVLFSMTWE